LAALLFLGHTLSLMATSQTFGDLLIPYIVKNQPNINGFNKVSSILIHPLAINRALDMSWGFQSLPTKEGYCFLNTCNSCELFTPLQGGVLTHSSDKEKTWECAICFTKKKRRALK